LINAESEFISSFSRSTRFSVSVSSCSMASMFCRSSPSSYSSHPQRRTKHAASDMMFENFLIFLAV